MITIIQNFKSGGNKPHYKGFIRIDGKEYEFAAWPSKSGKPGVFTGQVKEKSVVPQQTTMIYPEVTHPPKPGFELDDEIPF